MSSHALTRGRSLRLLGAAAVLTLIATAPPAGATTADVAPGASDPSEHNARVAEYLLMQDLASREHNARVAEHAMTNDRSSA